MTEQTPQQFDLNYINQLCFNEGWPRNKLLEFALDFITCNHRRSKAFITHLESLCEPDPEPWEPEPGDEIVVLPHIDISPQWHSQQGRIRRLVLNNLYEVSISGTLLLLRKEEFTKGGLSSP